MVCALQVVGRIQDGRTQCARSANQPEHKQAIQDKDLVTIPKDSGFIYRGWLIDTAVIIFYDTFRKNSR